MTTNAFDRERVRMKRQHEFGAIDAKTLRRRLAAIDRAEHRKLRAIAAEAVEKLLAYEDRIDREKIRERMASTWSKQLKRYQEAVT